MEQCLRAQVQAALDIDNIHNACFLCERLYACRPSEENTVLLARCYVRRRQDFRAVHVLNARGNRLSTRGRLLLAQALYRMDDLKQAGQVITAAMHAEIAEEYVRAEFHYLNGMICRNTNRVEDAIKCFAEALKCNPMLWPAFKELCQFGKSQHINNHFEKLQGILKGYQHEVDISEDGGDQTVTSKSADAPADEEMAVDSPEPPSKESPSRTPRSSSSATRRREHSPHTPQALIRPATNPNATPARPVTRYSTRMRQDSSSRRRPTQRPIPERPIVCDPAGPAPEEDHSETQSTQKRGLPPSDQNDHDTSMSAESENPVAPRDMSDGMGQMYQLFFHLNKGLYALSTYDHEQALQVFVSGLPGKQGEAAWVLGKIGCLYMQKVDYSTAHKYFMKARAADPTHFEDMDLFSSMLFLMEDPVQLRQLATDLKNYDRMAPETWCAVGNLHSSMREHPNALAAFQRAVQLDKYHSYAYSLCGHVYIELELFDRALSCFRQAVALDRRHHCGWYGMGMVHYLSQEYAEAAQDFRRAVAINPSNAIFRLRHGMTLVHLGQEGEALKEFQKATDLDRRNKEAFLQKGKLHYDMKDYEQAKLAFIGASRAANSDPEVHYHLGLTYKKLNEKHKAADYFYRGLDLNPGSSLKGNIQAALEKIDEDADDPVNKY